MIDFQGILISGTLYVSSLIAMICVFTVLILPSKKLSHAQMEIKFSDLNQTTDSKVVYGDTSNWKYLREKVLAIQGERCLCCGTKTESMHIDHIKPKSRYPHLEYMIDNLQVLCPDCNKSKSFTDETDYRKSNHLIALLREVNENKLLQRKYVYNFELLQALASKRFKAELKNKEYPRVLPLS
ncbi:HNH endonuclease [Bacteriovorax sp. Seq25_V]|uniref:HNH endonuclease n=1 Tax=Bacteriovorax sp. Seq25_V TaxID=1201288 RepID=UPI00038A29F2|nr:HNH endonuclease [Bacteriovorax sp. Seq25_V]EQC47982.1 bacteriophage Lambda NinG-like protein [Bacteriovorax sp. Seq25_V]